MAVCVSPGTVSGNEKTDATTEIDASSPEQGLDQAEIQKLISQLGSDEYKLREEATEKLSLASPTIVPYLQRATEQNDLEVTIRAVRIMEKLYQRQARVWYKELNPAAEYAHQFRAPTFAENPDRTERLEQAAHDLDRIDKALTELASSQFASEASRARNVLQAVKGIRQLKAMLDVAEMGGRFFYMRDSGRSKDIVPITREMIFTGQFNTSQLGIQIDRHWQNTDEGLDKLKRVTELKSLYLIKGATLTREQISQVQVALPAINVQTRGAARLGVTHGLTLQNTPVGARIGEVSKDGAAINAGLQRDDVIIRLDDHEITDFESLVRSLENFEAGDIVEIDFIRGKDTLTRKVELSSW